MQIKSDHMLSDLRNFGFHLEEKTNEGFMRYSRRIGNLVVTVANGQFENKIRISLLQDKEGKIRTSYRDILDYTEMICSMQEVGMLSDAHMILPREEIEYAADYSLDDNPLLKPVRKPEGFMAQ